MPLLIILQQKCQLFVIRYDYWPKLSKQISNIIKIQAAWIKSTQAAKYCDKNKVAMAMKSKYVIKPNCLKFDLLIYIQSL